MKILWTEECSMRSRCDLGCYATEDDRGETGTGSEVVMTEGIHSVRQKNSSVFTVVIDQLVPVVVVQSPVLVDLERPTAAASSGERQATASNVGADHVSLFEIASQKDQPRRRRSTQFEFQTVSLASGS